MQGVDKPLTLIPVVNGKPMFDKKVIANPGDDDFDFGQVDGVLEIPMAQSQYGILGRKSRYAYKFTFINKCCIFYCFSSCNSSS